MESAIHGICHMDSQDLSGPIFHPHVATSSVAEVVVKLILRLEPLHVLTVRGNVL
jgi:hypothetical protein